MGLCRAGAGAGAPAGSRRQERARAEAQDMPQDQQARVLAQLRRIGAQHPAPVTPPRAWRTTSTRPPRSSPAPCSAPAWTRRPWQPSLAPCLPPAAALRLRPPAHDDGPAGPGIARTPATETLHPGPELLRYLHEGRSGGGRHHPRRKRARSGEGLYRVQVRTPRSWDPRWGQRCLAAPFIRMTGVWEARTLVSRKQWDASEWEEGCQVPERLEVPSRS